MPDLLDGKPFDVTKFPPKTPEDQKALGDFFTGRGAGPKNKAAVEEFVQTVKQNSDFSSIKKYGALGYCWGGKVVSLLSVAGTPFAAAAECHPAMVTADDAKAFTIPVCMLASGDEDAGHVKAFEEALGKGVERHVETFGDQLHGWMAARADFENDRVKAEFERGYKVLLEWFHRFL